MIRKRPHFLLLCLTVLLSGMTILALELSASRLLGAPFGTGNVVWATIIGLILVYLSAGYFIGGRWADHDPRPARLYQIVAWGAFLAGLAPFAARVWLPAIAGVGLPIGLAAAVSMLGLFAVPLTLLGCVSPFAIRLALETVEQTGRVAGRIYAVSTLGSVIGAMAPVLYLLPEFGTLATMLIFTDALLLAALLGLVITDKRLFLLSVWMPFGHLALWAFAH